MNCVRKIGLGAGILGWLAILAGGFLELACYSCTPAESAVAPKSWPAATGLTRAEGQACLLLFLHPRCPCSAASVRELERALMYAGEPLDVCVVVFHPGGKPSAWSQTSTVQAAAELPGARIIFDHDAKEARRFGVTASGQVLLYSSAGKLRFSGGVTAGRGHEGGSFGRAALEDRLSGQSLVAVCAPVYGCPITAPSTLPAKGVE